MTKQIKSINNDIPEVTIKFIKEGYVINSKMDDRELLISFQEIVEELEKSLI